MTTGGRDDVILTIQISVLETQQWLCRIRYKTGANERAKNLATAVAVQSLEDVTPTAVLSALRRVVRRGDVLIEKTSVSAVE